MEFNSLIVPITNSTCRTCLSQFNSNDSTMFMNMQDLLEHDTIKVKLIDILIFLNCLENNDEDNWPQNMCATCVSTALLAYSFKLDCLKANAALSQILTVQSSPYISQQHNDSIDINVVYQDHEYEHPMFSHYSEINFGNNSHSSKEVIPLPPVTELTSTEQIPRKVGDKKYTCNICAKSFTRIHSLRYHMIKHNDCRKYLCSECGKSFYTSSGLQQHLKSHKNVAQFKCGFCNKTYKSRQSLKVHFRVAHSSNRKLFVCVTCGKSFTAKSTLIAHIKSHTGLKDFICSICAKTFTRASYLKAHSYIHMGQDRPKPFLCRYKECDRNFATKHSLLIHIAHAHSTERPHKCDICYKGFATLSGLKVHMESHVTTEVFCSVCNRKLASKRVLQKHMKVHNINKVYVNNNDIC